MNAANCQQSGPPNLAGYQCFGCQGWKIWQPVFGIPCCIISDLIVLSWVSQNNRGWGWVQGIGDFSVLSFCCCFLA